ncbi:hypothetical protein KS4_20690 [Poriferisphaera corsica]|uniref:Uncharacterized protein n=1 Tax=Poriferisphaera corsica TaxID=2528020 RepID=A0A517YUT8_9BACT|nr:hypothetical protein [Poriferisphaera corsica]QDU34008.1 hypothetical protein KS4_20690 [Poriferisphaera corsica]
MHKALFSIKNDLLFLLITLLISGVIFTPRSVFSQDAVTSFEHNQRWQEYAYGLSLAPPPDTIQLNNTSDGSLVKYTRSGDFLISVKILTPPKAVELADIAITADLKFMFAYPSAVPTQDTLLKLGGKVEALQRYLYVPDKEKGDWVFGQTFIKIDPMTFAMIDFECKASDFDTYTSVYNQVCDSIQLTSPDELENYRSDLIENGLALRERIDYATLSKSLLSETENKEQWFRLIKNNQDIGHMRIKKKLEEQLGQLGIRIEINAHAELPSQTVDTKQDYFESLDRQFEVWSFRKTISHPNQGIEVTIRQKEKERLPDTTSTAMTGTRFGENLTVTIDKDSKENMLEWKVPLDKYLSEVERILVFANLPLTQKQDFAFYGFNQNKEKLALMIGKIYPSEDANNQYWLEVMPGLDASPVLSCYDDKGNLLQQERPDGLVIIPAPVEYIKLLHDQKAK